MKEGIYNRRPPFAGLTKIMGWRPSLPEQGRIETNGTLRMVRVRKKSSRACLRYFP